MVWMMMFRNGFFGGNGENNGESYNSRAIATLQDTINTNHNNDLAFAAIQGNGKALSDLAGNLNVGVATLGSAISSIKEAIALVGANNGMQAQGIINSVLLGNKDLVQQIATCCCENKQLVTTMGYEGQIRDLTNTASITNRMDDLANGIQAGFSNAAYATQAQTNQISRDLQNQTQTIIDKISNLETNALQDKVATLTAQLAASTARAERAAELRPILDELNEIRCAQPSTTTVQYPQLTVFPSYYNSAATYGYYSNGQPGFWN